MTELAGHGRHVGRPADDRRARIPQRDDWRLFLVILAFLLAYGLVGVSMGLMALGEPAEPRLAHSGLLKPARGEIVDRNGTLLAGNLPAWSLYAHPREIKEPLEVAAELAAIFPDTPEAAFARKLTSGAAFVWIRRPITPRQKQLVHDLGRPGLNFGSRTVRVYPAGAATAHVIGGVKPAKEGVHFTELAGAGGAEAYFDRRLGDPERVHEPLALSIDLRLQTVMREVMADGIERLTANGGAGVLLDVRTGEVLAMASLPDFDPNLPPQAFDGPAHLNPRFNRAALGRYELGSTFKPLTAAAALDLGLVRPDTLVETGSPIRAGGRWIRDLHAMPSHLTVSDVIRRSSNVGAARLAMMVGTPRFKDYLGRLGFLEPSAIELSEAARAEPLLPPKWTDLSSMTISYGHGLAASPLHLAAAYGTLANGGRRVRPSLLRGGTGPGERIVSPEAAAAMMEMLREVVRNGTGRRAEVPGYRIGGKTGTADKYRPGGGYYDDRVIATFASVFPTSDPAYVLVVTLDEPTNREGSRPVREASRTAAPLVSEIVRRIAPIMGLRPLPPEDEQAETAVASARPASD
ncbi:MAG TPA: penicillin-binding protein 2 [Thermohalobaculum sp.]|nr:penicillin-binding protein 2 [Thermohalobaculum sp.]